VSAARSIVYDYLGFHDNWWSHIHDEDADDDADEESGAMRGSPQERQVRSDAASAAGKRNAAGRLQIQAPHFRADGAVERFLTTATGRRFLDRNGRFSIVTIRLATLTFIWNNKSVQISIFISIRLILLFIVV
jgi:hypothetical protein